MAIDPLTFRFLPRHRGVAWLAMVFGAVIAIFALVSGGPAAVTPVVGGGIGVVLGGAYLVSPTWRLRVHVLPDGLEVRSGARLRFALAWSDVARVVASPSTHTCFVDGVDPARSLLVPGVGAPAPYAIERSAELYALIAARAPRVEQVETLEQAEAQPTG